MDDESLGGFISFLAGTLIAVAKATPKPLTLQLDDQPAMSGRPAGEHANGRYFGGGMAISPKSDPADGHFDIITLGDVTRGQLYSKLGHVYRATHLGLPDVGHHRTRTLTIAAKSAWVEADGELLGTTPLTVRILPQAITVLV